LDATLAAVGLVILSPVFVLLAGIVRLSLGSPVLFRQSRPGLAGRPFTMLKFRTMREALNGQGELLPDEQRLGRIGRILRAASLDELPELWNVLKGDMSLVGPRPLLMEYLPLYSKDQARRHEVRPGITGWAQVNGRNAQSWEERFALDIWYVDHRSSCLDLRILWRTILKVFAREGISHQGEATMPKFRGTVP
jgi:lipopolysaccharide/colanic/teichoic acid biosynthesis glycosyltransferase